MSDKSKPPLAHLGQASNPDAARIEHWRDAALGSYVLVNAARERAEQLEAENARLRKAIEYTLRLIDCHQVYDKSAESILKRALAQETTEVK